MKESQVNREAHWYEGYKVVLEIQDQSPIDGCIILYKTPKEGPSIFKLRSPRHFLYRAVIILPHENGIAFEEHTFESVSAMAKGIARIQDPNDDSIYLAIKTGGNSDLDVVLPQDGRWLGKEEYLLFYDGYHGAFNGD